MVVEKYIMRINVSALLNAIIFVSIKDFIKFAPNLYIAEGKGHP